MDLIVAALATWQIVEIWHHSLLMAPLRARSEMWQNKLGELTSCPWCLSVWVGFACSGVLALAATHWPAGAARVVVYGFAASRLANLGNDFFKAYCLTPRLRFDWLEPLPSSDEENHDE
jgi:hypothetical protein